MPGRPSAADVAGTVSPESELESAERSWPPRAWAPVPGGCDGSCARAVVLWRRRRQRVLELDRASGRHHGGRQQRRHVAGAGAQRADRRPPPSRPPPHRRRPGHRRPRRRRPRRTPSTLASTPSGPSVGTIAANRRLTPRSWWRNSRQPAQSRMWRRAVALGRSPRSWATISSSRMSEQAVSRASSAWARPSRARTSSDLTAGTVTPRAAGHVGVGHPAQLAHEQRRALLIGQSADVGDQPPERLALVGLGDRVVHRRAQQLRCTSGGGGAGRRSSSMQRLWATRYSQARSASSRWLARRPA